jgi:hypothetical protein
MTGKMKADDDLMYNNTAKVKTIAKAAGVTSVSITGKGEPTLNWEALGTMIGEFSEWPVELQTNGIKLLGLANKNRYWSGMFAKGLNVLAISIDNFEAFDEFQPVWKKVKSCGGVNRATVNISNMLKPHVRLEDYIKACKKNDIHQLTFRQLRVPDNNIAHDIESTKAAKWIDENVVPSMYNNMQKEIVKHGRLLYPLPYGAEVYDIDGISVTAYKFCMQEKNSYDDIRALIFQEDGHLYMTWNSKASILF